METRSRRISQGAKTMKPSRRQELRRSSRISTKKSITEFPERVVEFDEKNILLEISIEVEDEESDIQRASSDPISEELARNENGNNLQEIRNEIDDEESDFDFQKVPSDPIFEELARDENGNSFHGIDMRKVLSIDILNDPISEELIRNENEYSVLNEDDYTDKDLENVRSIFEEEMNSSEYTSAEEHEIMDSYSMAKKSKETRKRKYIGENTKVVIFPTIRRKSNRFGQDKFVFEEINCSESDSSLEDPPSKKKKKPPKRRTTIQSSESYESDSESESKEVSSEDSSSDYLSAKSEIQRTSRKKRKVISDTSSIEASPSAKTASESLSEDNNETDSSEDECLSKLKKKLEEERLFTDENSNSKGIDNFESCEEYNDIANSDNQEVIYEESQNKLTTRKHRKSLIIEKICFDKKNDITKFDNSQSDMKTENDSNGKRELQLKTIANEEIVLDSPGEEETEEIIDLSRSKNDDIDQDQTTLGQNVEEINLVKTKNKPSNPELVSEEIIRLDLENENKSWRNHQSSLEPFSGEDEIVEIIDLTGEESELDDLPHLIHKDDFQILKIKEEVENETFILELTAESNVEKVDSAKSQNFELVSEVAIVSVSGNENQSDLDHLTTQSIEVDLLNHKKSTEPVSEEKIDSVCDGNFEVLRKRLTSPVKEHHSVHDNLGVVDENQNGTESKSINEQMSDPNINSTTRNDPVLTEISTNWDIESSKKDNQDSGVALEELDAFFDQEVGANENSDSIIEELFSRYEAFESEMNQQIESQQQMQQSSNERPEKAIITSVEILKPSRPDEILKSPSPPLASYFSSEPECVAKVMEKLLLAPSIVPPDNQASGDSNNNETDVPNKNDKVDCNLASNEFDSRTSDESDDECDKGDKTQPELKRRCSRCYVPTSSSSSEDEEEDLNSRKKSLRRKDNEPNGQKEENYMVVTYIKKVHDDFIIGGRIPANWKKDVSFNIRIPYIEEKNRTFNFKDLYQKEIEEYEKLRESVKIEEDHYWVKLARYERYVNDPRAKGKVVCMLCNVVMCRGSLVYHIVGKHWKIYTFKCLFCKEKEKRFVNFGGLQNHIDYWHL